LCHSQVPEQELNSQAIASKAKAFVLIWPPAPPRAQVLRGYAGDRGAKPVFEGDTPFDILGGGYQRPFELATLRLANMISILPRCGCFLSML
jgi:hypothetical protein